jgi:methyl-accepting chemotaxis protein
MTTSRFKVATLHGAAGIAGERWPSAEPATDAHLRVTDSAVALRNVLLSDDAAALREQADRLPRLVAEVDA